MAVGTLNIAVTAETRKAQAELRAFRAQVTGLNADVQRASTGFGGNTINDFAARFGAPKMAAQAKAAVADLNNFRSSVVDLSRDTARYSDAALKSVGTLSQMRGQLTQLKQVLPIVGTAVATFTASFAASKLYGEYAFGLRSIKEDAKGLLGVLDRLTDPRQAEFMDQKRAAHAEGLAKAAAKAASIEEKRQQTALAFEERLRTAQQDRLEAQGFKVDRQFGQDVKEFGAGGAHQLKVEREAAAAAKDAEAERAAKLEQAERAREQRAHAFQEAQEKARQNAADDERAVAELRKGVADFWKSDVQREREGLLATLEDPRLRRQAQELFQTQDIQRQVKREAEQRKDDAAMLRSRQDPAALDARTVEGYQQLRSSLRMGGDGIGQKTLVVNQRQVALLESIDRKLGNGAPGEELDIFDF